jgi:ribonucleoside-diphosphate reductase alpha chain
MSALKELQNYTFVAKYARWNEQKQRRETWKEAVDRVRNMMLEKYSDKNIDEEINWAYDLMQRKRVLGSQRALQFGGKPIFKKNARIYNCLSSYCDRLRFFQECFWLMLCGGGCGFSVQKHHIAKLPTFAPYKLKDRPEYIRPSQLKKKTFVVPDTIEGWSDALGVLLSTYFRNPVFKEYYQYQVEFDFSQVRPKGSRLSSGMAKAPGPEGLKNALNQIRTLLNRCVKVRGRLRPIDAYDIVMHTSDAVLSGGVRRSATIAIFSPDDEEMATAKTGNWREENPQRARSNNSALLLRGQTSKEDFAKLVEHIKEWGEPGFVWADDREFMVNPCSEIGFYCYDQKGKSGWAGCNLSTVNCANLESEDDFFERVKAATIIGTLQAGFTNLDYLGRVSESIFKQEALLGVSMTGIMDNFEIALKPSIQAKAAKLAIESNIKTAKQIGINPAARITCCKPEGTTSTVLGTSSGIHPHHSKRYLRRVQANTDESVYKFFKERNPQACERSVWSANDTDDMVIFPVEVPDGSKTKNQLPALKMLEIVKSTQINWVNEGRVKKLCVKPWLTHNVSNTITVCDSEWEDVIDYIYKNRQHFTGITLIPMSGDKDYVQAPFTTVYTSREIVREYGDAAIWCSGLIERALELFKNGLWEACDGLLNTGFKKEANESLIGVYAPNSLYNTVGCQIEFYDDAHKFADKYFNNDIKKLTYCLKDVYNWKLYCDLSNTFEHIDYTQLTELEDNTKPEEEISCAGGACLL